MFKLFFITGASGSGKTTIVKALAKLPIAHFDIFYFDSIGVPDDDEMIKKYGSPEEWQKCKTEEWAKNLKQNLKFKHVILDGQVRPQFIQEACQINTIANYEIILFDCSDEERKRRLHHRGQPELASEQMMKWAQFLRENCQNFTIIDNTFLSEEQTGIKLMQVLNSTI